MVIRVIAGILLIPAMVYSCSGRKTEKAAGQITVSGEEAPVNAVRDTSLLFDGKTLDGWEITNFGPQGPVYVSGSNIMLGMGDGCTGVTRKGYFPKSNYEVTLEAKRVEGNDFFCGMTFPVKESFCSLIVGGWAGTTVGISSINRMDASENETTSLRVFEKNRWYTIRTRVTDEKIEAWIDNEQVVNLTIGEKKLSTRPEVELSKPFGIASWRTTAAIRNIKLKYLE